MFHIFEVNQVRGRTQPYPARRNFTREINGTLIVRNQYCDARNGRH